MRRRDDQAPPEGLIAGFAVAGVILFAGTLLVGFSARDFDRQAPPPAVVTPVTQSASSSG
jgi:hypothetical protein